MTTNQLDSVWSVATIFLGFLYLVHCVPVEIVYTGEACECPSKLGYEINVPTSCSKQKKYIPAEYGYKLDVPVKAQHAKVSYSFDFTVEEPCTPRPPKPQKWNLFAKVDRVTLNKEDCVPSCKASSPVPIYDSPEPNFALKPAYNLPLPFVPRPRYASPPSPSCSCGACGITRPLYRYVYKKVQPCQCQRPNCMCNMRRPIQLSPNSMDMKTLTISGPLGMAEGSSNNVRRRRDIRRIFFFRRRRPELERPVRYIKIYHKSLPAKSNGSNGLDALPLPASKSKRIDLKSILPRLRARLVKRDIKGEYDLLEKEREQLDLTLPEIVQFMPETLQADFKRGKCYFGCSGGTDCAGCAVAKTKSKETQKTTLAEENMQSPSTIKAESLENENENEKDQHFEKEAPPATTIITVSYAKRNAGNYNAADSEGYKPAATAPIRTVNQHLDPIVQQQQQQQQQQPEMNVYRTQQPHSYSIPTNPFLAPGTHRSAYSAAHSPAIQELNSGYNAHRYSYAPANTANPLRYVGDLEAPPSLLRSLTEKDPILVARRFPVQHVSNEQLDRIIKQIVARHSDFIEASSHPGGALIDPEPWQEKEALSLVKKLIDGRLSLWFDNEEEAEQTDYQSARYQNPYHSLKAPPALAYTPMMYWP